jgi:hypothetical protein
MHRLSAYGQRRVEDIAQRYGVSTEAVHALLAALLAGHGTMAQFNHPDLGGAGQWMQGGMTMVGDMFNQALKAKVDGVCTELSRLLAESSGVLQSASSQAQSQSQGGSPPSGAAVSLFVPAPGGSTSQWWPAELGIPSSTGAQNSIRYAYFPASRRLAIDINGHVTVYDTLHHQISGVSQQQSAGASLTFTSQVGLVQLASLPVVSVDSVPQAESSGTPPQAPDPSESAVSSAPAPTQEDIITKIERLAELRNKGVLTEEEFVSTKAELLKRL